MNDRKKAMMYAKENGINIIETVDMPCCYDINDRTIYINLDEIAEHGELTDNRIASIILHELGHVKQMSIGLGIDVFMYQIEVNYAISIEMEANDFAEQIGKDLGIVFDRYFVETPLRRGGIL